MKVKQHLIKGGIALGVLIAVLFAYHQWISPTKVAFINFPEFQVSRIVKATDSYWIEADAIEPKNIESLSQYDAIYVFGMGLRIDSNKLEEIKKVGEDGTPVFVFSATNPKYDVSNIDSTQREVISEYLQNAGNKNYASLLRYTRKNFDHKSLFTGKFEQPSEMPSDVFYDIKGEQTFSTLEEYEKWYQSTGNYKPNAPKVALLTSIIGPFNSNTDHIESMIHELEVKGMNVYPISSFRKKIDMMKEVNPDLIVYLPHGRLNMMAPQTSAKWLKEQNVPILCPLSVFQDYKEWLKDPQGMFGGLLSQSVSMPELDGGITPYAVIAQFEDERGFKIFKAIPGRMEKFADMAAKFIRLKKMENKDKKVAIYYYKGPGLNAMVAANMEIIPSMYKLLQQLKASGYTVDNMPASEEELEALIQKKGPVLGPYALGTFDKYVKQGDPALVSSQEYMDWANNDLQPEMIQEMKDKYGAFPGSYMNVEKEDSKSIAVTRIQLGNIVLLPQPLPGIGDNTFQLVHGAGVAPTYPYVASYLWTRNAFEVDAIIHFGTHGSLEFTPGKQIALSDYDWTDPLIGNTPHFYIYTISNVGEGMIAKRRSYATLVSHLTPPFIEGETYNELKELQDKLQKYQTQKEGSLRTQYAKSITKLAINMGLHHDLDLDSTAQQFTEDELFRMGNFVEEIGNEKITGGLYTLGEQYTDDKLKETVKMMSIDPIAYALSDIDLLNGKVSNKQLESKFFFNQKYRTVAEKIFDQMYQTHSIMSLSALLRPWISPKELTKLSVNKDAEVKMPKNIPPAMKAMMAKMKDGKAEMPKEIPPAMKAMMEKMAKGKKEAKHEKPKELSEKDKAILEVNKKLVECLESIEDYQKALSTSPEKELNGVVNALNGGYILPSPGGDPITNPNTVPTGRNLYAVNAEATPTQEAWKVGKKLGDALIKDFQKANDGRYPKKISFTLWSGSFIETEGATIAEIFYLLGIEPVLDHFNRVTNIRLIPEEELGRPRIDVVVQTSGQFRDLAASRLFLIQKAIKMAANADDSNTNFVKDGVAMAEKVMIDKGLSPKEAREMATYRIFGGVNGNYGTGIMDMVESSDRWDKTEEVAEQYLYNMGAVYGTDKDWGEFQSGIFEAALQNTEAVVQPRQSNTWGALSLDHMYEFMGGLNNAVTHVTGKEPVAYLNDYRNPDRPKIQGLKEAIQVEARSTLLNPKYIQEYMKGGASSAENFAETFRNTFGWNVMKESVIEDQLWNDLYDVYVEDKLNIDVQDFFKDKNPYALEEISAVMLETVRKGLWDATPEQIKKMSELHADLVKDYKAGCSGFVCDNAKLKDFISEQLDADRKEAYEKQIDQVRTVLNEKADQSVVLKKEEIKEQQQEKSKQQQQQDKDKKSNYLLIVFAIILLLGLIRLVQKRRKQDKRS